MQAERSESDRRSNIVSHAEILTKLVAHDDVIAGMAEDIRYIKEEIVPLTAGIKALSWLGKAILAIGALAAAGVAIAAFFGKLRGS